MSKEFCDHISKRNEGRIVTEVTKAKISKSLNGENHFQYGIPREELVKEKIKNSSMRNKNGIKKITETKKRNCGHNPSWNKGKKMTPEFCKNISDKNSGKRCGSLNPAWNGGTSFLPYCSKFNKPLKRSIRNRDKNICQLCNKSQQEENSLLSVHHIHYDRENCYPDLICLCRKCNAIVNKKTMRKYYEKMFMNKLNDKYLLFWTKNKIKEDEINYDRNSTTKK